MKLLWMDIETTGLIPQVCNILEICALTSDIEDPFATTNGYNMVLGCSVPVHTLHPKVQDMHNTSGLFEECRRSNVTLEEAEQYIIHQLLPKNAHELPIEEKVTLAGSSVSFEKKFIDYHMPQLAACLHYRLYDVSSIKLFCRSLGMSNIESSQVHRAEADLRHSIGIAVECERWLAHDYPSTNRGLMHKSY